jgi:hypothetical protein
MPETDIKGAVAALKKKPAPSLRGRNMRAQFMELRTTFDDKPLMSGCGFLQFPELSFHSGRNAAYRRFVRN